MDFCSKNIVVAWLLLLSAAPAACAQDWARKMFNHTSHDFGVVARGAKVQHTFILENIFEEDAHIESVRSSCGCTSPEVSKNFLKTWEKAEIKAVVDTRTFLGRKEATLTVVLDRPFPAEVQLRVYCYIRGDVVVQPGSVQFGSVALGKTVRQKVSVSYAGRSDWKIERVECANKHVAAQAVETSRGVSQVNYDLWVTLKEGAPAGYIQDFLFLVTNDYSAQASRVPVPVEAVVAADLTARPSPLMLGLVQPGESVTRPLVVQGKTPFRIVGLRCDDARFKLAVPREAKLLHVIPVTFIGGESPGKVSGKIRIDTDQAAAGLEVGVQVQIVPKSAEPPSG